MLGACPTRHVHVLRTRTEDAELHRRCRVHRGNAEGEPVVCVVARLGVVSLMAAATAPMLSAGEATKSLQATFNNRCRTCHSIRPDDHRLGPSLHGIVGRKAGQSAFPAYSEAMRTSGIVWDAQILDRFIEDPEAVVPGNNMQPYPGITDPGERKAIVEYLVSLGEE